ncbi:MAG: [FeFe] hydrogenase H-cluster radical SAM maturase HydE [Deltaproteobacteria bacterium]|nr:[FeFe] hydrogenase H-cluster radical SAM maturase HydE [Deltaproteobacteria bacterium]
MHHLIEQLQACQDPDVGLLTELLAARGDDCELLRAAAHECMRQYVGEAVYFRGLVEVTNICSQNCYYCGIRKDATVVRYRLSEDEILLAARECMRLGFGSMVLQSGEISSDAYVDFICRVVARIKSETRSDVLTDGLGITLSIGVLSRAQYQRLFDAGAHRYLLRIETSNEKLFRTLHPEEQSLAGRYEAIHDLQSVGFQTGTGVMIGVPGQSMHMMAADILTFRRLDIDMVGMGPYLPSQNTPMAGVPILSADERYQLGLNMIALTRLVCQDINIASTTALEGLHPSGRLEGLRYGANVAMPNLSPVEYRPNYRLYDDKPTTQSAQDAVAAIEQIGRKVALNTLGDPRHYYARRQRHT